MFSQVLTGHVLLLRIHKRGTATQLDLYYLYIHYVDVIMSAIAAFPLFAQSFAYKAQINENIKAPRHRPFLGESTGHRWIPLKKGL